MRRLWTWLHRLRGPEEPERPDPSRTMQMAAESARLMTINERQLDRQRAINHTWRTGIGDLLLDARDARRERE